MENKSFLKPFVVVLSVIMLIAGVWMPGSMIFAEEIEQGLVAWWSFDNLSGSTVYDEKGSYNATVSAGNEVATAAGRVGSAAYFDGSGKVLLAEHSGALNFTADESYTLSFWMKPDTLADVGVVTNWRQNSSSSGGTDRNFMGAWLRANGALEYQKGADKSNKWYTTSSASGAVSAGNWYNVVLVQDAAAGQCYMYINGSLAATADHTRPVGSDSTKGTIVMGSAISSAAAYKGLLDEVKLYNTALSSDTIINSYAADTVEDHLLAYYSFDEISGTTVTDLSGNGYNGTIVGTVASTEGKVGSAVSFTGSGNNYISVDHKGALNFNKTDSYTMSFWIKANSTSAGCIINNGRNVTTEDYMGAWFSGGTLQYQEGKGASGEWPKVQYNGITTNRWYKIDLVQDGAASKSYIYLNGVKVAENSIARPVGTSATKGQILMGTAIPGATQYNGLLDEVRLYDIPLTADAIENNYKKDNRLLAYWSFDDLEAGSTSTADMSGNGYNATVNGTVNAADGVLGSAAEFTATKGSYIVADHAGALSFDITDSYTLSFWMKPDKISDGCVINNNRSASNSGTTDKNYMGAWLSGGTLEYQLGRDYYKASGTEWPKLTYKPISAGTWYNVALVQNAATGKTYIYINGQKVSESSYIRPVEGTSSTVGEILMGTPLKDYNATLYDGLLDEVKLYSDALSHAEIAEAYDVVANADRIAYWSFDDVSDTTVKNGGFLKNNADGTIVGSPAVQGNGIVGNAMFFNNDGDGFTAPDNDSFDFASSDSFSLSAWVKADSFGGWRNIAVKNREDSGAQYYGLFLNGDKLTFAMGVRTNGGVKSWPAISAPITIGEWYHVVLVSDGEAGKSYMYLNGALVGTFDATYDYKGSTPWEIGGRLTAQKEYFKGGIDELKLYNLALAADEIKSEYEVQEAAATDYATFTGEWPTFEEGEIPNIILDMDLGGDSDDLGAIAITYYYHQQGLINLLATTTPRQIWYAGAMSAINTYFGYPDMPMGFNGNEYNDFSYAAYGRYLATHFSNPLIDKMEYENSVDIMRKTLAAAEDNSVTFCVTGTYTNLYNLLRSPADEHSDLSGYDLVKQKVKWVIGMGCQYPDGREANIYNDVTASAYVNANWPTPIVYSTWEIGNPVMTASRETLDKMDENNPIRAGYEEHFKNLGYGIPRQSWDPITAYFACGGFDEYYDLHRADVAIDAMGNNVFYDNGATGARAYLTKKEGVTDEGMAVILDDIMVAAEGRIENGLFCDYVEDTDTRLVKQSADSSTETVTHNLWNHIWYDTYYRSEDVGASVELSFEGTSFVIYGGYLPEGGIVDIYLDGQYIDSVDTYKATNSLSSYIYHKDGLSKTAHTLKLVTSSEKNTASSGNAFLLDYIKVDTFELAPGDVNGDDKIDICDLVGVQNIILGKAPSFSAADLNSDGKIDSLDTSEIRKAIISK